MIISIQWSAMDGLVGHENVFTILERTVREGRPAHAYLFSGLEGIGKKKAAVKFACLLNCHDPAADHDGTCPVCRRIVGETHPDFSIEKPERGMIRIDRVRFLQNYFRYAPVEGNWRVTLIDDAHLMNRAAQNAILKTLEEPPPQRMIILVTAKPYLLLSTVRSRCRRVRFRPIPTATLADFLQSKKGLSAEKAWILAAMGFGSVSRSLEMDNPSFSHLRELVISVLSDPGLKGISGIFELSSLISADRNKAGEAIQIASTWIRDLLQEKIVCDSQTIIHRDYAERISDVARHYTIEHLFQVYEELTRSSLLVESDINVNRNLVMDVMLLRIARILIGSNFGISQVEA